MNIVNTYCPAWYHYQTSVGEGAQPMFVLTKDAVDQYAVYAGVADLPDPAKVHYDTQRRNAAEAIAAHGSKLTWKQARGFFDIPEEKYRA